jgi:hypothetical protein
MRAIANFAEILTGTSTKTLVQVATGTNTPGKLVSFSITFQGIDNLGVPIKVELLIQTTAGTADVLTMVKLDRNNSASIQASAQETFTVEPTASDLLYAALVHPQGGWIHFEPDPEKVVIPAGARVGLRVVTPAATVDCVGWICIDE